MPDLVLLNQRFCILLITIVLSLLPIAHFVTAQEEVPNLHIGRDKPEIKDPNLKVELVSEGLELPTSISFLGSNDILVIEKDKGTVQRIVDGKISSSPLLDVNVANKSERGMLGSAVAHRVNATTYVFLYYTESLEDGNDDCPSDNFCNPGNDPLGNRLYRYELINDKLVNPKLILDLPGTPGPAHNGGSVTIGPDNNVYLSVGDIRTASVQKISSLDGRGGILRINQDGKVVKEVASEKEGILDGEHPLNLYYAYGIRNSFGIDFDPVTGNLWDTENGPNFGDEINLVEPGFNSGWNAVQGIWPRKVGGESPTANIITNPSNLLDFEDIGKYSAPEITWFDTVGPTAIKFLNSDKLGKTYKNDMFVGDVHNGFLYNFKLDQHRRELLLEDPVKDRVVNTDEENRGIIFGKGFGSISDLEVGPDGYLYVVSIARGQIYRIVPDTD